MKTRNNKGQFAKGIYQGRGFQIGNKLHKLRKKPPIGMLGKKHNKETREKISKAVRKNPTGKQNAMKARAKISVSKMGEKNPNWKGGIYSENERIRQRLEMRLWREAVFMRDCYTCQECGKRGNRLQAHHIKSFSQYPELRFAIDNGLTLCIKCHRKTDNFGGNK